MAKRKKKKTGFDKLLLILVLLSSIFLIYNILLLGPIEVNIRYIIIGIILFIDIIFLYIKNSKKSSVARFMMFIFIIINVVCGYSINKVYAIIDSINKNNIVYSSSLITLSNKKINSIDDVKNYKIGLSTDTLSVDNYIIPKEIIDDNKLYINNNITNYDDVMVMLNDLYAGKIDLMFISSSYKSMFQTTEGFENIGEHVKVIYEKEKKVKKDVQTASSLNGGSTVKPFSILLMGVDSEKDGLKKNSYANGDGLMLITFNPDTLNITMMSIPRDSYVPISCRNNTKNKLTHAGWFGTDCMIQTIENVFDVDINYYLKVNFKGVVSLVDKLGGVTVDVPKRLCTDDSNRSGEVCIEAGVQTLNGEEALVLARNRYDLKLGDIDRGYNQQLLLKGLINKMTEIRSVSKVLNVLEEISNNLDTNLSTDEILSFYNIFKDVLESRKYQKTDDFLNIIQIKLAGENKIQYFEAYKKNLWCYLLKDESVKEASLEMRRNLDLEDVEMIKDFKFKP